MMALQTATVWHHRGLNRPSAVPAHGAHSLRGLPRADTRTLQRFGASSRARLPPCATTDPQGETSSSSGASAVTGSSSAAAAAAAGDGGVTTPAVATSSGLALLQASEPIDRLRYQAMMLFDHFDADKDGSLIVPEMEAFFAYCRRKVLWSPGLAETLQQVQDASLGALPAGAAWTRDQFVRLIRAQVHAVSTSAAYQASALRPDELARLRAQMGLAAAELCAAKWVHGLLDFDGDGLIALIDLEGADGIEAYMVEDKLLDADANGDGFLTFEEFASSYARPRPIGKNVFIMAVNTVAIWALLQSPLDLIIKAVLVAAMVLRPQLISRPATLVYDGAEAIFNGLRARLELVQRDALRQEEQQQQQQRGGGSRWSAA